MNCRNERGFSLPELMMAALLLLILVGAIFQSFLQGQKTYPSEQDITEATQNARYALDFMSTIIKQAGNDPRRTSTDSCAANAADGSNPNHPSIKSCSGGVVSGPCIQPVQPTNNNQLRVLTDITGSGGNSDKGDPNGDTCGSYEDVTFQYSAVAREIQMILGNGSPIPIAKDINNLTFSYFRYDPITQALVAVDAAQPCQIQVVRIRIEAGATNPDPQSLGVTTPAYVLHSDVQIRSRK